MAQSLPVLKRRDASGHKGTYGKVLLIAGSRGMAGAAGLCGLAALRGGAGLVTVACPEAIADVVAGYEPSYLTLPLECDDQGRIVDSAAASILNREWDAIGVGPGLGQSDSLGRFLETLLSHAPCPVVVDADGLNLLVQRLPALSDRSAASILTPHPGEFSRLTGKLIDEIQQNREELAMEFARRHGVVMVLKGHQSVVTDGDQAVLNPTGNPGMATGGTGDVLTGLITALLGQGLDAYDAARLAAYLHGDAGDIAAELTGEVSLIASDLIDHLPAAFSRYFSSRGSDVDE